jgi:hypothetical protein
MARPRVRYDFYHGDTEAQSEKKKRFIVTVQHCPWGAANAAHLFRKTP